MEKQEKNQDNCMEWVLETERFEKTTDGKAYYTDYEICSEAYIGGVLEYGNGVILCSILQSEANRDGLYAYLLRIKQIEENFEFNKDNYSENGYYFEKGIVGELIALFSVCFQCRFFHKSTTGGELSPHSIKFRSEYEFNQKKPHEHWHYEMFSKQKRNWADGGIATFLDKIKLADGRYHQKLIWACDWYAEAIKEIGLEKQLFYAKMVFCIEALLKFVELPSDSIEQKMKKLLAENFFIDDEKQQINNWIENRRIGKKFKIFLQTYSKGFFDDERTDPAHCCVKEHELNMYAGIIYSARSNYLHTGKPLYISDDYGMEEAKTWDLCPSGEIMIDRRKISGNDKLPRIRWFERITNYCLKNFINTIAQKND